MTLKRFFLATVLIICSVTVATQLHAQVQGTGLGPKAGLYLDGSHFMLGATFEIPLSPDITFEPDIETVFGILNSVRFVGDLNGRYSFILTGLDVSPFILAGVGAAIDFNTPPNGDTFTRTYLRANIGGGVTFNTRDEIQPWGGIKIHFGTNSDSDVLAQGGVNFYF